MVCGYFRAFLAVLAAFGAFFGYLCRLNLSLVIDEMVVKDLSAPNGVPLQPAVSVSAELARSLTTFRTEEQTVAELAAGSWWMKQRALLHRVKLRPAADRSNRSAVSRRPPPPDVHTLSIEFDVGPHDAHRNGTDALTDAAQQGLPTTTTTTTESSAPAVSPVPGTAQGASGLLDWNAAAKNDLLGAFFIGYVVFQVPAGRAAELLGPKPLLIWHGLGTGLASLVFPYAARYAEGSIGFAYGVRVVMGAAQAGIFPACYVLLCEWLPKSERSAWLPVPSAMGRFGTIFMNLVVPSILVAYSWEWVFYASGSVTLAWTLLVLVFASDRPVKSWWLSRAELVYLESRKESPGPAAASLSLANLDGSTLSLEGKRPLAVAKPSIDWRKMLTSRALHMLTLVMFTSEWSNMLLLIKLPGFGKVLGMELEEIGFWSSALVLIYCVVYPLSGVVASRLEAREKRALSSLRVRKLFEGSAQALQAASCLTIAFVEDKTVVLCALSAMMVGRSLVGGGQCLMPPELSKDYPGSVLALSNAFANCAGFAGPWLLNALVTEPTSHASWRAMWLLSAAVFALAGLLFCWLADNRPQNYCKRPKLRRAQTTSLATLVLPPAAGPAPEPAGAKRHATADEAPGADEIIRMGSFSRVSSEPQPARPLRAARERAQQ